MKLTKTQKLQLKNHIQSIRKAGGFIHIFENGITRVYIPASKAPDNRMFFYGQSVCNASDKYKRKLGIHLAISDMECNEKTTPLELIDILGQYVVDITDD